MLSRTALLGLLGLFTVGSAGLVACGGSEEGSSPNASDPTDDELKKTAGLGSPCNATKKCKTDLVCKPHAGGPPPGAMGMPLAPGASGGPPPGAMGMPLAPPDGICSTPDPGTEGGSCSVRVPCEAGLTCEYPAAPGSGPPPGAMGLPVKPGSSGGPPPGAMGLPVKPVNPGGPPPGAMGLPIMKIGICQATSSGPPPGAMGMPLNPNK